jgi:hypothetical protein|nr:MAG TPA: hypothetical protein [Caudoviricetes sp.]
MKVYVVMACTYYDGDLVDSVYLNEEDAKAREVEIDNGATGWADYGSVIEMEVL